MVEINTEDKEGVHVVIIEGDVDASSSIFLDEALTEAEQQGGNIVVDASRLEYISSAGLGVFMSRLQDYENENRQMILFGLSEKVMNVFQILGLDELLTIVENFEEAKERVNAV